MATGRLKQLATKPHRYKYELPATLMPLPKYTNPKSTFKMGPKITPKLTPKVKSTIGAQRGAFEEAEDVMRVFKGRGYR